MALPASTPTVVCFLRRHDSDRTATRPADHRRRRLLARSSSSDHFASRKQSVTTSLSTTILLVDILLGQVVALSPRAPAGPSVGRPPAFRRN